MRADASGGSISGEPEWPEGAIVRVHERDGCRSQAVYSACEVYRYALTRAWGAGPRLNVVMLNPSTADERRNDPTIERCERRARAGGFGAMRITNLFALRATDPRDLKAHSAPVGPDNDAVLTDVVRRSDMTLCGWGVHGTHMARGAQVIALLRGTGVPLHVLDLTRDGHPRHPLYMPYARGPRPWLA